VRAALEQLFGAGEQPRLGRVAEHGAIYATETTDGGDDGWRRRRMAPARVSRRWRAGIA
jgi:hypothetical protein